MASKANNLPPVPADVALADGLRAFEADVAAVGMNGIATGVAAAGHEFERLVRRALELYAEVRSQCLERAERVRAGQEPYGGDSAKAVATVYREWYAPSRWLLSLIDERPQGSDPVAGREELLKACRQASLPATVNVDRLMRGLQEARRGEGIPLQEAMSALRRQRQG